jgi:hypothetical protein
VHAAALFLANIHDTEVTETHHIVSAEELAQLGPADQIQVIDEDGNVVVLSPEQMQALAHDQQILVEEDWGNSNAALTHDGQLAAYDDDFEDDDDVSWYFVSSAIVYRRHLRSKCTPPTACLTLMASHGHCGLHRRTN